LANNIIISDTSCLIALERINKLSLLHKLFSTIQTTQAVAQEFGSPLPEWVEIRNVTNTQQLYILQQRLDAGEASAIALALETTESILIIDEKKGRKIAQEYNLELIGTLQILLFAKTKGLINSVKDILNELEQNKFRCSAKLKMDLLEKAGEK
jgi:predicted nucleic acid-binding protein